jgi:hypothetical protein
LEWVAEIVLENVHVPPSRQRTHAVPTR